MNRQCHRAHVNSFQNPSLVPTLNHRRIFQSTRARCYCERSIIQFFGVYSCHSSLDHLSTSSFQNSLATRCPDSALLIFQNLHVTHNPHNMRHPDERGQYTKAVDGDKKWIWDEHRICSPLLFRDAVASFISRGIGIFAMTAFREWKMSIRARRGTDRNGFRPSLSRKSEAMNQWQSAVLGWSISFLVPPGTARRFRIGLIETSIKLAMLFF